MSKVIKLNQISSHIEGQLERLLRETVLHTNTMLKKRSPVDTGRFRASWQVGENAASSTPAPEGDYTDTYFTEEFRAYNYIAKKEKLGNTYNLHNNLPYAEVLAQGRSKQASAGWVDLIGKEVDSFVQKAYKTILEQT